MLPEAARFKNALYLHARNKAHETALCGDGAPIDYATLRDQLRIREAALEPYRGRVLALAFENSPDAVLWDLAALFSGVTCVWLPPFFSVRQRAYCLAQSQVSLVLADAAAEPELEQAGFTRDGGFWRRELNGVANVPLGTAKITYTSGTTGTPKGVCLSAESLLRVARELECASQSTRPERYLAALPLAILLENLGIYAALIAGATVIVPPQRQLGISGATGVDWPRWLGALAMSGAQSVILVPQLLLGLVTAIERGVIPAQPFRFVAVGGARVSPALLQRAAKVGLPVYEGYGLSECASVVCLNRPGANRPGSVGRPLPHVNVKLAADGEVLVGGSVQLGYLGEAPFAGEWWPTGDIGEFDADGYLYLRGRKKHQFITSFGRNVNPDWVEGELTQRGDIAQAFVHGEGQPRNVALLWPLDPGCSDALLAAAVAKANATLPDYARVHVWMRLPEPFTPANGLLTTNGRLRRDEILARYGGSLAELAAEPGAVG
jgi:long-subunit acyl-CoA synthetase (AMP-forming)